MIACTFQSCLSALTVSFLFRERLWPRDLWEKTAGRRFDDPQDDHFETDPPANMPRGLVHVAGSERRVLSHPGCPPSQTILEIHIQRGSISIQGPAVWATPGSLHFYAMHGCGSLPSATDGNLHTQLPRRLAHSGPVAGGLTSHKTLLLSHLHCLGLRVNFAKSILSPSQWVSLLGTVIDSVQMTATVSAEWAATIQCHAASFKEGTASLLNAFQSWALW